MIRPPRTAVLAAVVVTTMACKRQPEQGPFPEGAVGKVAVPPPTPGADTDVPFVEVPGTEALPPELHKVGIVAEPHALDEERVAPLEPPATEPRPREPR